MNEKQKQQLQTYLDDAGEIEREAFIRRWSDRVTEFLKQTGGADEADHFRNLAARDPFDELALKCGHLEGLIAKDDGDTDVQSSTAVQSSATLSRGAIGMTPAIGATRRVFVVHGHDGEVKVTVARFLEKLELQPVILHEQPNQGRTVIEKFELSSSDVAFAVVLLTPDDIGTSKDTTSDLRPRARQNVILELGYFLGRLGRTRVCALYRGDVELPSDYQGVLYIEFDSAGAWRAKLAQEFVEAKLTINLQGLIH